MSAQWCNGLLKLCATGSKSLRWHNVSYSDKRGREPLSNACYNQVVGGSATECVVSCRRLADGP